MQQQVYNIFAFNMPFATLNFNSFIVHAINTTAYLLKDGDIITATSYDHTQLKTS